MSESINIAKELISINSITPNDNGCLELIETQLKPIGFNLKRYDSNGVSNLYAKRGTEGPLVVFAGHTDVVPPGPIEKWNSDPFVPTEENGILYGRGSADMKSSLAAFVVAIKEYVHENPNHHGTIGLFITSDEEGIAIDGTKKLLKPFCMTNKKLIFVS